MTNQDAIIYAHEEGYKIDDFVAGFEFALNEIPEGNPPNWNKTSEKLPPENPLFHEHRSNRVVGAAENGYVFNDLLYYSYDDNCWYEETNNNSWKWRVRAPHYWLEIKMPNFGITENRRKL